MLSSIIRAASFAWAPCLFTGIKMPDRFLILVSISFTGNLCHEMFDNSWINTSPSSPPADIWNKYEPAGFWNILTSGNPEFNSQSVLIRQLLIRESLRLTHFPRNSFSSSWYDPFQIIYTSRVSPLRVPDFFEWRNFNVYFLVLLIYWSTIHFPSVLLIGDGVKITKKYSLALNCFCPFQNIPKLLQ